MIAKELLSNPRSFFHLLGLGREFVFFFFKIMKNLFYTIVDSEHPAEVLREMHYNGLLKQILPFNDALYGVPQNPIHHPEIDVGRHIELVMDMAVCLGLSREAKIAALFHDLGKGVTPKDILPRHIGHEASGASLVLHTCEELGLKDSETSLAVRVCTDHLIVHKAFTHRSSTILKYIDLWQEHALACRYRVSDLFRACEADARGREGLQDRTYFAGEFLQRCTREVSRMPNECDVSKDTTQWHARHEARLSVVRELRAVYASKA